LQRRQPFPPPELNVDFLNLIMDEAEFRLGMQHAERAHDRRLRKHLLALLYELRSTPSGWAGAITLRDAIDGLMPPGQGFASDNHCIGICRDLSISGLAEERSTLRRKRDKFGLQWLEYRITAAGIALITESAPPNPLVDDDRLP
jgi:hypothetical protein